MKKQLSFFSLFFFLSFLFIGNTYSQIVVSNISANANFLVDQLVGTGVTYSNAQFCGTGAFFNGSTSGNHGIFNGGNSVIGINTGVILSTGNVMTAPGPNINGATSTDNVKGGDATLNAIVSPTGDAIGIEFDFVPESNVVSFRYVFASEEYNEYVGDVYNDIFGFFVSGGPEAYSNKNIAIVPGTPSTPVTINNINNGSYSAYYHDNSGGAYNIEFDGLTTVLTATCNVTPCQTYHMKLIVADVYDRIYDSGVFLESGSFSSPTLDQVNVAYSNPSAGGNAAMVEGCSNAQITFGLSGITPFNRNIPVTISGTATYGTDYYTIPALTGTFPNMFVTIPAGTSSTLVTIVPNNDASVESTESVTFNVQTNLCGTPNLQSGTVNILDNTNPFTSIVTPSQNICLGNSATITITPSGGQSPVSYLWNPTGSTSNSITVSPGSNQTYSVTATDACGSTTTGTSTVNIYNVPNVNASPGTQTFCSGQTTNIGLTSGVIGTTFSWTTSVSGSITGASNSSGATIAQTLTNNGASQGSVTYTVTPSANGCSGTPTSVTVYVNPKPVVNSVTTTPVTSCSPPPNGSITVNASGGTAPLNYSLDGGANTTNNIFSNIGVGIHQVVITDNAGCQVTASSIDVQGNSGISITSATSTPINCYGDANGTITINCPSAVQFSIDNGTTWLTGNSFTGLTANIYNLLVEDATGCQDGDTISVLGPPLIVLGTTITDQFCLTPGNATVNVSGGVSPYSYNWSNAGNNATISGLSANTYTVTVTDSHSCTQTIDAIVGYIPSPGIFSSSTINNMCFGDSLGAITVSMQNGTGPFVLHWSNISDTTVLSQTGLASGIYNVTISDSYGCTVTGSDTISQPSQLSLNVTTSDLSCFGYNDGSITANCSGGSPVYLYYWSGPGSGNIAENLPEGAYAVTITDSHNCSIIQSNIIINSPTQIVILPSSTNPLCFNASNGSISTTVSGGTPGYTYLWTGGASTSTLSNIGAGIYELTVTDVTGCFSVISDTLIQPEQLLIDSTISNLNMLCFGENSGSITPFVSGGTPTYNYLWSNDSTSLSIQNISAGNYTLTISDMNGCTLSQTYTVTQPSQLQINEVISDITCNNSNDGSISVSPSGGTPTYQILWSNNSTSNSISNLTQGIYGVTITDINNCVISDTNLVITNPILLTSSVLNTVNPDCYNGNNGSINISVLGGTPSYTYLWSNGSTNQNLDNVVANSYSVTITDSNGCTTVISEILNNPAALSASYNVDTSSFNLGEIYLSPTGGNPPYTYLWSNNATSQDLLNLQNGIYYFTITDANNCLYSDSALILNPEMPLIIPSVITPNNDGKNDDFEIKNIELYQSVSVEVYNRWGDLLFKFNGTGHEYKEKSKRWNGTIDGKDLPMGSYVYIIIIDKLDPINGVCSIIR